MAASCSRGTGEAPWGSYRGEIEGRRCGGDVVLRVHENEIGGAFQLLAVVKLAEMSKRRGKRGLNKINWSSVSWKVIR